MLSNSNHGSFYFNQLAALYLILEDRQSAYNAIEEYFTGIYMNQILASGEQPFEAVRTQFVFFTFDPVRNPI
jgi:hypothetical protein